MTLTRWTLDDLGGELGWVRLLPFVQNLPPTSALARAMHPDRAEELAWANGWRDAALLADIYDAVTMLRYELACMMPHRGSVRKPDPHKRPGDGNGNTKTLGSGAVGIREFERWWNDGS